MKTQIPNHLFDQIYDELIIRDDFKQFRKEHDIEQSFFKNIYNANSLLIYLKSKEYCKNCPGIRKCVNECSTYSYEYNKIRNTFLIEKELCTSGAISSNLIGKLLLSNIDNKILFTDLKDKRANFGIILNSLFKKNNYQFVHVSNLDTIDSIINVFLLKGTLVCIDLIQFNYPANTVDNADEINRLNHLLIVADYLIVDIRSRAVVTNSKYRLLSMILGLRERKNTLLINTASYDNFLNSLKANKSSYEAKQLLQSLAYCNIEEIKEK